MGTKLNHENLIFKVSGFNGKQSEPTHKIERQPKSIKEMVDEIEGCDLCQHDIRNGCYYHRGLLQTIKRALKSPPLQE